ncbi:MAG: hypothetical protein IV112_10565 [Methyloversatilis discipulorum]|uniref:hypothetical protein n=1 Tax=Methyloversatilis discipulorum TaxID=1119528 RepID=UPI0026F152A2|nr:hypothetical protein [Methyloversatilis discipulorum]MBT9517123.1 hypothetical protein [Methyloversatilis discipulorum]
MARNVGDLGENCFNRWCIEENIVCNKATIDKTGTDFFVEFPLEALDSSTESLHRPALECKVQVKATDKATGSVQVKLSNLRRMATAPLPTFIVVIEYSGGYDPVAAYVVHFDDILISRVLKHLHELKIENQDQALNRKKISINYRDSVKLADLTGTAVIDVFRNFIGPDLAACVARKKNLLESLGYEEGGVSFHFGINGKDTLLKLIDISLGKSSKVEVLNVRGFRKRFNRAEKTPFLDMPTAMMSMPDIAPSSIGTAIFRKGPLSPPIELPAKHYTSQINSFVPKELARVRIDAGAIDFTLQPYSGKSDVSISLTGQTPTDLYCMSDSLHAIELLCTPGQFFLFEYRPDVGPSFSLELKGSEFKFDCTPFNRLVESTILIANFFGISRNLRISWDELQKNEEEIMNFASLLTADASKLGVEFVVTGGSYSGVRRTICAAPHFLRLGNYILGVIVELEGSPRRGDSANFELDDIRARLDHKLVLDSKSTVTAESINKELESLSEKYKNDSDIDFISIPVVDEQDSIKKPAD